MGGAGTIILVVVLFGSPLALIVIAILWRRAAKARAQAETALAELEPATEARIEAIRAQTADEIQRLKDRMPGLLELDAEKERVASDLQELRVTKSVLKEDYRQKKEVYDSLSSMLSLSKLRFWNATSNRLA